VQNSGLSPRSSDELNIHPALRFPRPARMVLPKIICLIFAHEKKSFLNQVLC
jgi:hypothetical protein